MNKEQLEPGMVVELRDGYLCLLTTDHRFYTLDGGMWHCELNDFLDDLTTDDHEYDIVKVYADYHMTDVLYEREEQPSTTKDTIRQVITLLEKYLEECE